MIAIDWNETSYPLHVQINMPDYFPQSDAGKPLNAQHPAEWGLPQSTETGETVLLVEIHSSIPKHFIPIALFHEMFEAEAVLCRDLPNMQAHKEAVAAELEFAMELLDPHDFKAYIKWRRELPGFFVVDGKS